MTGNSGPPISAFQKETGIFGDAQQKPEVEVPLGRGPTPRRWIASPVAFRSSGFADQFRVPVTILVTAPDGKPIRETVAYVLGKSKPQARARAAQLCDAFNARNGAV